uniref:Neuronal acetylcholine receptor subunit alpha-7-like n=1 Tax=Saccoglossus kowalevskii TaxID=10224 RepID=A0ABM0GW80_SACKO|nr:PREDICTED: neuronal acetylcholine receptor subunit alpha-7-like [Saccoglossus kowalevskii]
MACGVFCVRFAQLRKTNGAWRFLTELTYLSKVTPVIYKGHSTEMLAEQKLYKRLFHDYNKKVRPVWNASHPINVSLSISITQLMDLDERNQALTTNVWIAQHWKDEKLRWNANEFDDIQVLRIPAVDIWFPDITLYNTADENGFSVNLESNALVYSNGQVSHWSKPTLLKSTCKIIVRYFPFDYQQCRMKFGSWTYNSFQVNLQNDSIAPDMSTFMPNEQWDIVYAVTRPHVVRYDCCPESYPDVTFVIGLKRKPLYYVYNVVLPCVLLTALSLVGFNMPFNIGVVKVSLGVMLLLSLGVFNLQVSQTMPKTSEEISLLDCCQDSDIVAIGTAILDFFIYKSARYVQIIKKFQKCSFLIRLDFGRNSDMVAMETAIANPLNIVRDVDYNGNIQ